MSIEKPNDQAHATQARPTTIIDKAFGAFFISSIICLIVTTTILSSNPLIYLINSMFCGGLVYVICRFIGFFVKRDRKYYDSEDYKEEDV